ncbi:MULTISPECIES: DUF3630 family protein [Pseudomonas syringae group]|uniref:DUF3630 domain-containing protein n=4 Tax=Pseudomonas syringae group TaxID=136849 RepID=A0A3M3N0I5_9PSED|nr:MULTISPECIES: DUF3630 family protein [Pseudomonas syringae group]KPC06092.1 Uncharacterized protein AC500_2061 [Pseudomonas amygdali pv. lachrymans]EGH97738.1 hypothetical protein PLA106_16679 [Pseudomonas amygdali pv. lachrymans str. M302278]KPC02633.1 Uncharacterized protein AC503_4366 [Pseudomonas syringae pv. maculicola]RMM80333.1 hypothetical protein ALQ72_05711 [Pseudomonas syringae pv. maculicola]RMN53224.1 hypothetical protein ALQ58_100530 [Pseudomonas syringae pv. apii]
MTNSNILNAMAIEKMHSGHSCLSLSAEVDWEGFPRYAEIILGLLGGTVTSKSDAVDVRVWDVQIKGEAFFLAYEDFPSMVSLESKSAKGDALIEGFLSVLSQSSQS